jgi:hypothetical protein
MRRIAGVDERTSRLRIFSARRFFPCSAVDGGAIDLVQSNLSFEVETSSGFRPQRLQICHRFFVRAVPLIGSPDVSN